MKANPYQIRLALWGLDTCLLLAVLGVSVFGLSRPEDLGECQDLPRRAATSSSAPASSYHLPPLDHYAVIWQRPLRQMLYDPVVEAPPPPPKPQLRVRLVGTAVEPGFTYGVFVNEQGKTVLCRIGEKIAGAEVKAVTEDSVTVLFAGETLVLKIEKKTN